MKRFTITQATPSQSSRAFQPAGLVSHNQQRNRHATVAHVSATAEGSSAAPSRREVMAAGPGLLAAAAAASSSSVLLPARPAAAAAAPACDFVSSPSGLQYCDVQEGAGPEPIKGALIRCHYTGRLASNNRVFDSSYERGRPLTFKVGVHEVISGWDLGILGTEGIPPMKEGGKRVLLIPAELGYGSRGAGGVIPPNATLVFEVELLGKPGRR